MFHSRGGERQERSQKRRRVLVIQWVSKGACGIDMGQNKVGRDRTGQVVLFCVWKA